MVHENATVIQIVPRLLRLRDAPAYLGMDRNRFNKDVRSLVTEIRIGSQGIAFDRLELDAWVDQYKARNERPRSDTGDELWDENTRRVSAKGGASGISRSRSRAMADFTRALARVKSKRRSAI
ncbi:MAG: hypothetical protein OEM83_09255 [Gammaproteobacteria bacterium]|nr:hypothetical protein [Gammaproteobacteria bacterium]